MLLLLWQVNNSDLLVSKNNPRLRGKKSLNWYYTPLICSFHSFFRGLEVAYYEGCSKSNASYFMMLTYDIRGRWWYGSRGWIFPPVFYDMLLPCDGWQQRSSLWHSGIWSVCETKVLSLNSCVEKGSTQWHSSILAEHLWRPNSGFEHSEVVDRLFQPWQQ